jgi:ribonuclease R
MFVELDNTIEGLIRLSSLEDDYYNFDSQHHTLTGERRRRVFRIGDIVKIQVSKVNVQMREIDFVLVD